MRSYIYLFRSKVEKYVPLRPTKGSIMGLLHNFKTSMQQRALRRILAQQSSASRGAMHYDHARQVSILFNASELKEREFVLRFAEKLTQNGKSSAQNRWIAYNRLRGQYNSAMEHVVPEQFWVDKSQCSCCGDSTVTR